MILTEIVKAGEVNVLLKGRCNYAELNAAVLTRACTAEKTRATTLRDEGGRERGREIDSGARVVNRIGLTVRVTFQHICIGLIITFPN